MTTETTTTRNLDLLNEALDLIRELFDQPVQDDTALAKAFESSLETFDSPFTTRGEVLAFELISETYAFLCAEDQIAKLIKERDRIDQEIQRLER